MPNSKSLGLLFGFLAYFLWGFFPLYWKLLSHVSPFTLLCHRIFWGLPFLLIILFFKSGIIPSLNSLKLTRKNSYLLLISAFLIAVNWYVFVYAITNKFVVEASFGYFLNPLVSVALGMLVLGERLRRIQWLAVLIAALGVSVMALSAGGLPWISLTLAGSFGLYGLLRKLSAKDTLSGVLIETSILYIPASFLLYKQGGLEVFLTSSNQEMFLISLSGIVTMIPLLFFGLAAKRVDLTSLGILQYLAPTLQFLIGVFVFKEAFSSAKGLSFLIVWIALAIFSVEAFSFHNQKNKGPQIG